MALKIGETSSDKQQYYKIKFQDIHRKNNFRNIEIPIGTSIKVTTATYEIKEDGIYKDGQKVEGNEIGLTVPQLAAIDVFDANHDGRIDINDQNLLDYQNLPNSKSVARQINDKLARNGSEYYVFEVHDEDGSIENAAVSSEGFGATFYKASKNNPYEDVKEFYLQTAEQRETENNNNMQREEEYLKRETELDKAYAKAHPIRNFFGITREEYEKNNPRDY